MKRACSPKFSQRCEDGKCEEGRCEEGRCEVLLATSIYTCFYLIILNLNNRIPNPLFSPRFIASIHVSAYCTQYAGYWTTSSITHTVVCVILKYPKYTVSAILDFCKYPQVSNYPCVTRADTAVLRIQLYCGYKQKGCIHAPPGVSWLGDSANVSYACN